MDDMVYNALRRKLAAAKAIGDLDRINRIRAMMPVSEEVASEVPADVIAATPAAGMERFSTPWIDAIQSIRNEVKPIGDLGDATVDTDE